MNGPWKLVQNDKGKLGKKTCNKIILHRQNYIMEDPRPASPLSVMGTHSHNYIWIIEYLIETKFSCPPHTGTVTLSPRISFTNIFFQGQKYF